MMRQTSLDNNCEYIAELYMIYVSPGSSKDKLPRMSISIPSLIGPIDSGSSFMIASIQNNIPFILNGTPYQNGLLYYWESNLTTISSSATLGVFTAQGTLDSLTITDTVNGGGIAFRSDGVTIGNATSPATIKMSQSLFANWFPPDIFLSAVIYSMLNDNGTTANILTAIPGTGGTGPTIPANNLIILPILWYFNCTQSGSYDIINQPLNSIINWFCIVTPSNAGCAGINITKSGFTNLPDCTVGNNYTYCPVGDICGNKNCKGPCSVIYDDCNFSSGNYVCVFNPANFFADTKWWESPYFIGVVVGIIIIIIIIIIVIFAVVRHGKNVDKSSLSGYESSYISQ